MDDKTQRILEIISTYSIPMSELANQIGVPRATFSHLKSGRNKVSLDLLEKIKRYDTDLDIEYVIMGKNDLGMNKDKESSKSAQDSPTMNKHKKIERVMIFYSDLSFEEYRPGESSRKH